MECIGVCLCVGVLASPLGCRGDDTSGGDSAGSTSDESSASTGSTSGPIETSDSATTEEDPDTASREETTDGTVGTFPGCGTDPGFRGTVHASIESGGVERTYVLSLPADYDPMVGYPLVFGFHGRGGNADQFRSYSGVEAASGGQAIFVYPQGLPIASMGGQTGWDLGVVGPDVAFVRTLYEELVANLCIDPARVYATGHSFGGYFSNTVGCGLGDLFRAIAPVSGGGPFGACKGEVAAIVMHGIDDPVVPTAQGEGSRDHWRSANGCGERTVAFDPDPCVMHQGCNEGYDVVWCLYDDSDPGLGTHTWPGFAGSTIWSVFESH